MKGTGISDDELNDYYDMATDDNAMSDEKFHKINAPAQKL